MKRGNPNLKPAHASTEMTYEQIEELKKCMVDPIYFIKKYVYVLHPKRGRIKFELYDFQEELIRSYQDHRYNIVLSARQTGKTETSCAYMLWYATFHSDKTILVVSKDSEAAMEIIKKIQDAYEELPMWLKPGIQDDNWNKHTAAFDNKSRIIARSTTETAGRGLAISLLYCDELAFVKPHIQQSFWNSVFPTLSTGGGCIISSTPNGDVNLFSKMWHGAENHEDDSMAGPNGFYSTRVYWDQPPGRDEKYKNSTIAALGLHTWLQEYECEFISSDNSLFDSRVVKTEQERHKNKKIAFTMNGEQDFFKPISQDMVYIVGVDPATGSGEDYSVIQVFEFPSMIQVMEYRDNTVSEVVLYSHLKKVVKFLEKYSNDVYFSVESNGVGRALIALYMQDDSPPMSAHFMSEPGKNKLGYVTTSASKRDSAIRFKNMFERHEMTILSNATYIEMKNYIRKGDGFAAQTGATDDCISAIYIILRMLDEIAMYDPRAYDKLYKFSDQSSGDEWYSDGGDSSSDGGNGYYSDDMPIAGGLL